jgi:thiol-disulfide isomerase/thioredoxin
MTSRRWKQAGGNAVLVAVVGIVLAGCGGGAETAAGAKHGAGGDPASEPALPVLELNGTDPFTGKRVSFADYAGVPIVLNFWASWCPPCRDELPELVRFARMHPELVVIGVVYEDAPSQARRLRELTGATFPNLSDPRGELAERLGLQHMPTTFYLDADHRAVAFIAGGADLADFENGLELAASSSPAG